jgi:ubiquinone/menaquinone biosynthesis C-methylase UbiE
MAALTSRSNTAFYDRVASFYDDMFVWHTVHAVNMGDALAANVPARQGNPVLDLGCGTGRLSAVLAARGYSVVGVDLSYPSLAVLRQSHHGISVANADILALPFADETFSAVVSLGTWRHLSDLQRATNEVCRVLKRDGILVIGYFPPAFAGVLSNRGGVVGRTVSIVYNWLTWVFGFSDRADTDLEREALAAARLCFEQVRTQPSGSHWRLIVAGQPIRG